MHRSGSTSSRSPWWEPSVHADRRPFLMVRNRIRSGLRRHFDEQDFVEVDPAALQISPGNETHLQAFATDVLTTDGCHSPLFLHTSPEFACKKLLAAGEPRLYSLSHVYRNRERGPLHHPEFTMLEWYRTKTDYRTLMEDCFEILGLAAEAAETNRFSYRGIAIDPFAEPERVTVAEAFHRFADIDLLSSVSINGQTDRETLATGLRHAGIRFAEDDTWADLFTRVLVERIEPKLGNGRATILFEYPVAEAALARPSPQDPRVAERFELYACGVELANAFGELTDPAEQRRRFEHEMAEKARIYGDRCPIDEDFLAALEFVPDASGAALGFDRLVMLATGARRIDLVMWAPVAEAAP